MRLIEKIKEYHFEWKHLLVLFIVLIAFQSIVTLIHKTSLENLLGKTNNWYEQDSAEKLANLTATSLELLLETNGMEKKLEGDDAKNLIKAFNIILSQQVLQHDVQEMCILVPFGDTTLVIEDGQNLYSYFYRSPDGVLNRRDGHHVALELYSNIKEQIHQAEQIYTIREGDQIFHVFVPLVPYGEFAGAVYIKISPNLDFIYEQIMSSYDETALIFSALIFLGLMAMFFISSYTVKQRDETQKLLYDEREKYLREQIDRQKESLFTKRIYHTHHKAEKIMGYIKEDLREMSTQNIEEIKYRVNKYANFISRVIYDMKWYDPPLQTIRSPLFNTDLNEVIQFILHNIFQRVATDVKHIQFETNLDKNMPKVQINEFVVWEIVEPLIQNCIDHSNGDQVCVKICTLYSKERGKSEIIIEDNGNGIIKELLESGQKGIKKIFLQNISTKTESKKSGYGCYLAYEISKKCGWNLDVENIDRGGCRFILNISH